jgi:D-lactate dehydrogenase
MKIAFFSAQKDNEVSSFETAFPGTEVVFIEEVLNPQTASKAKDADIVSVFVDSSVNKETIESLPNLKMISTRSVGYNHIDVDHAKGKAIAVANVPSYGSHTVAEFAFALMLSLSRKIYNAAQYTKSTSDFNYNDSMKGFDLHGRTLGVVGTGRIGKNSIQIAKGFGMNVVAYDPFPDAKFAAEYNFTYKTLEEVTAGSDIVTLHAPYTKENFHLIDQHLISKMKKGVYIINTARGELMDTAALVDGLKSGTVAGAGLDVLESENLLKQGDDQDICRLNRELMQMDNVIVTPHTAFYSREAVKEIADTTVGNIAGFLSGKPQNLI